MCLIFAAFAARGIEAGRQTWVESPELPASFEINLRQTHDLFHKTPHRLALVRAAQRAKCRPATRALASKL